MNRKSYKKFVRFFVDSGSLKRGQKVKVQISPDCGLYELKTYVLVRGIIMLVVDFYSVDFLNKQFD